MNVTVSRSGGIAGFRCTWELKVDDQPDPEWWTHFLAALPWDHVAPAEAAPDRYLYRIRCGEREVELPEPALSGAWRELVELVQAAASAR